jgi:hypothetical protein
MIDLMVCLCWPANFFPVRVTQHERNTDCHSRIQLSVIAATWWRSDVMPGCNR